MQEVVQGSESSQLLWANSATHNNVLALTTTQIRLRQRRSTYGRSKKLNQLSSKQNNGFRATTHPVLKEKIKTGQKII